KETEGETGGLTLRRRIGLDLLALDRLAGCNPAKSTPIVRGFRSGPRAVWWSHRHGQAAPGADLDHRGALHQLGGNICGSTLLLFIDGEPGWRLDKDKIKIAFLSSSCTKCGAS